MDVLGVVLAVFGLLSLLSLLSEEHGILTGWWVSALTLAAGVGAIILPVGLMLLGVWLVLRKVERIPSPSTERMIGILLLYANILTILHLSAGGGWELAAAGEGGGYIGAFFEWLLVSTLGVNGAWVAVVAWLVIAIVLTLDISVTDLIKFFTDLGNNLAARWKAERVVVGSQAQGYQPVQNAQHFPDEIDEEEAASHELPADFIPMPGSGAASKPTSQTRSRSRGPAGSPSEPVGGQSPTRAEKIPAVGTPALPGYCPAWKKSSIHQRLKRLNPTWSKNAGS